MKNLVTAALLLAGTTSAMAAGQLSPLVSYESVFSEASDSVDPASRIVRAGAEYIFPRSLALYGSMAFADRESYDNAISVGARFYSPNPILKVTNMPVWGYLGAGLDLWDHGAYYPEVGLRFAINSGARVDLFLRAYGSNDTDYDGLTTVGIGLTF